MLKIDLMSALSNKVALPGIDHHFGLNAERFQRMIKLNKSGSLRCPPLLVGVTVGHP